MEKFTAPVYPGESITRGNLTATIHSGPDMDAPWDNSDGHGVVSDWTSRDKNPGERVLCSDRHSKRFYDVQASTAIAKRDEWDAAPYGGTKGEKAARAVEADYEYLRQWCNDEWFYVGVVVTDSDGNHLASLWGIESNSGDHINGIAAELFDEAHESLGEFKSVRVA